MPKAIVLKNEIAFWLAKRGYQSIIVTQRDTPELFTFGQVNHFVPISDVMGSSIRTATIAAGQNLSVLSAMF